MDRASPAYYDLSNWTDAEIIHFIPAAGIVSQVLIGIHGYDTEEHEAKFNDWEKPEYEGLRRAVADAYLYGMYMRNMMCEKHHGRN